MTDQLPAVFIGSSVEGLSVAREVEQQLQHYALTTIWKDGVFLPGSGTLETLLDTVHQFDFAVMILSPDDVTETRNNARHASPRDNVIFELGLFMGHLGRKRSFIVHEEGADLMLPSDLAGITLAPYSKRDNLAAALSVTCTPIIRVIKSLGFFTNQDTDDVGHAVLKWLVLSKSAREKLAGSQFIRIGGTRYALMTLVNSAKRDDSILAICGYKGDYSTAYYQKNFEKCKAVSRVFSYEAILSEINDKQVRYALDGLKLHLDETAIACCDVEVFLIPKETYIKHLGGGSFDPPLSFGLTILLDGSNLPRKAVVHWEIGAEPLKHLIDIEGVIIDGGQEELLNELLKLHEAIARSDFVLSSKKHKDTVTALCAELENLEIAMS